MNLPLIFLHVHLLLGILIADAILYVSLLNLGVNHLIAIILCILSIVIYEITWFYGIITYYYRFKR